MKNFKQKLRELLFNTLEYGKVMTGIELPESSLLTLEDKKVLIKNYHVGFRKAQNFIVEQILEIQSELEELQRKLKLARSKQDTKRAKAIDFEIQQKFFEERVYRKVADSIAWQLFYGQNYFARRLYLGNSPHSKLSQSNIKHTLEVVNELHTSKPSSFALISDITSFIGIGDILFKDYEEITVIELKEGKMNEKIKEFLDAKLFQPNISLEDLASDLNQRYGKGAAK